METTVLKKDKKASAWKGVLIGGVPGIMLGAASGLYAATKENDGSNIDLIEPTRPDPNTDIQFMHAEEGTSFAEAFAEAREEFGPGGVFEWKGNLYNTYYKEEWDAMTPDEKEDFLQSVYENQDSDIAEDSPIVEKPSAEDSSIHNTVNINISNNITNNTINTSSDELVAESTINVLEIHNTVNISVVSMTSDSGIMLDDSFFGDEGSSFLEAFAEAREEFGPGGVFEWNGNLYNTYYKEEWDAMTPEEKEDFLQSIYDEGDDSDDFEDGIEGVDTSESEIHVFSVQEEVTEDGIVVTSVSAVVDGHEAVIIDVDGDGNMDEISIDMDNDGIFEESETADISELGLSSTDMENLMETNDGVDFSDQLLADDSEFNNDADISSFA